MKIIITDLTRFRNDDIVCIAGIDKESKKCIRPLPYIKKAKCKKLSILPGAILEGNFTPDPKRGNPHSEDMHYNGLKYIGDCSSNELNQILKGSLSKSISSGFTYPFNEGGKVIPHTNPPAKSIITIKVSPQQIPIVKDGFVPQKIKLNLRDNDNKKYSYLPITDLGFFNYTMSHYNEADFPKKLNDILNNEKSVYLRIGLSGKYKSKDGRDGYWLQVNGIYTFPNYSKQLRCY